MKFPIQEKLLIELVLKSTQANELVWTYGKASFHSGSGIQNAYNARFYIYDKEWEACFDEDNVTLYLVEVYKNKNNEIGYKARIVFSLSDVAVKEYLWSLKSDILDKYHPRELELEELIDGFGVSPKKSNNQLAKKQGKKGVTESPILIQPTDTERMIDLGD